MKRILFVEDDLSLINGLSFAMKKQGYEVDIARTSLEAEALWINGKYDLVILDISLPDGSGFDICKRIRQTSKIPIMFLTATDEETDIIMGLDIGADDYITKPFKLAVFLSRINALLRRSDNFGQPDIKLSSNGITLQRLKGEGYKKGELLDLTSNARIKQYGAMRAVGMDGRQLTRMIAAEAFTYAISGLVVGCGIGLFFSRFLHIKLITRFFGIAWSLPLKLLCIIFVFDIVSAVAAVYAPSKRIRNMAITETINEL